MFSSQTLAFAAMEQVTVDGYATVYAQRCGKTNLKIHIDIDFPVAGRMGLSLRVQRPPST